MEAVKLVAVRPVVVLLMSVITEEKLSVDSCHFTILPVLLPSVSAVLLVPVHTVALLLTLPPTLAASTVRLAFG